MSLLRPESIPSLAWFARLGQPGSLTWQTFGAVYILGLMSYAAANEITSWYAFLGGLASGSAGHLAMFALLGLATLIIGPRAIDPWRALAGILFATAVRGLVVGASKMSLGLAEADELPYRIVMSVAVNTPILVGVIVAQLTIREHRAQRDALLDLEDRLVHVREEIPHAIGVKQAHYVDHLRKLIRGEVDAMDQDTAPEAVFRLRRLAHDIVRPMSHELATEHNPYIPSTPTRPVRALDWREVIRIATAGAPFHPIAWALMTVVPVSPYALELFGVTRGVLQISGDLILGLVLASVANALIPRLVRGLAPISRAVVFTLVYAVAGVVTLAFTWHVLTPLDTLLRSAFLLLFAPLVGWTVAVVSAIGRVRSLNAERLKELNKELDWEVARVNERQLRLQRQVARALHGPLQATLNAAALRIDAAVRDGRGDNELVREVRDWVVTTLREHEATGSQPIDPKLAFERIKGTWAGVCDVRVEATPSVLRHLEVDQDTAAAAVDIVTEACSNAVRHGGAQSIQAKLTVGPNRRYLRLEITDDGEPAPTGYPGMGTQMLDQIAIHWERQRGSDNGKLIVDLPLLAKDEAAAAMPDDVQDSILKS